MSNYSCILGSHPDTVSVATDEELQDWVIYVPERTCRAEMDWDAMEEEIYGYRLWRCSCGELFMHFRGRVPQFCPECGAKVVE